MVDPKGVAPARVRSPSLDRQEPAGAASTPKTRTSTREDGGKKRAKSGDAKGARTREPTISGGRKGGNGGEVRLSKMKAPAEMGHPPQSDTSAGMSSKASSVDHNSTPPKDKSAKVVTAFHYQMKPPKKPLSGDRAGTSLDDVTVVGMIKGTEQPAAAAGEFEDRGGGLRRSRSWTAGQKGAEEGKGDRKQGANAKALQFAAGTAAGLGASNISLNENLTFADIKQVLFEEARTRRMKYRIKAKVIPPWKPRTFKLMARNHLWAEGFLAAKKHEKAQLLMKKKMGLINSVRTLSTAELEAIAARESKIAKVRGAARSCFAGAIKPALLSRLQGGEEAAAIAAQRMSSILPNPRPGVIKNHPKLCLMVALLQKKNALRQALFRAFGLLMTFLLVWMVRGLPGAGGFPSS